MKNKGLLILGIVLVVLIGGAYALYNNLSAGHQGNIMVQENVTENPEQDSMQSTDSAETGEDTDQANDEGQINDEDQANGTEQPDSEKQPTEEKMMAPVFGVVDGDGNSVQLSDFYGKPIVVNFWASWCGPCKSEMPDFQAAYETHGEDVNFLMVNLTDGGRETIEKAQSYITDNGYTFPVYFDTESDGAITYGVTSIPSTFFIDAEGHAIAYAQGAINGEMLQSGLDMIME